MKTAYFLSGIALLFLFISCKPDFDLNAPYQDVPVVYGILNYKDSIHYVKIYKGFQSHGGVSLDAQNPDSIYYYDQITAVLQEYKDNQRTARQPIPLYTTNVFPRDSGFFYYDKDKMIYYTTEPLSKDYVYKIVITHLSGKITEGKTPMVGAFNIVELPQELDMTTKYGKNQFLKFSQATNAADYEIHVNFLYFEVNKKTNKVVYEGKIVKNITPHLGETFKINGNYIEKTFPKTYYSDIAGKLSSNPNVTRYIGTPKKPGICIEIEAWAADTSLCKFLKSNEPTSSFQQVNIIYSNLKTSEGLAFGFFSSRFKAPVITASVGRASEDSLITGSKTRHLGFRYYTEYVPE